MTSVQRLQQCEDKRFEQPDRNKNFIIPQPMAIQQTPKGFFFKPVRLEHNKAGSFVQSRRFP
jgi:hypothetical protein